MEQAATAPETDLGAEEPQSTPVAEQVPEQAPAPPPQVAPDKLGQAGKPSDFQAEFTRRSQENADVKKALGLAKDSGREDVLTAINKLKTQQMTGEEDADPRLAEINERAMNAGWRVAEAYYPGVAPAARELLDYAQTETDPEAITRFFYEILNRFAVDQGAEAPAAEGTPTPETPPPMHLSESDTGPSQNQQVDAELEGLRGSGRVAEGINILFGRQMGGKREAPSSR
jgi:hypothetical protein